MRPGRRRQQPYSRMALVDGATKGHEQQMAGVHDIRLISTMPLLKLSASEPLAANTNHGTAAARIA